MATIDPEILKHKTANRRAKNATIEWKCAYCKKSFVFEKSFLKHKCKWKYRMDEVKTPLGQSAYASYGQWLSSKKNSKQSIDTFIASSQYTSFIKFASYCQRLNIDANHFISFIVQKHPDITPVHWTNSTIYTNYLKFLDAQVDPWTQVAETREFLERKAEAVECSVDDIFRVLSFNEIVHSIRLKKISPWYLYHSIHGVEFLRSLDDEQLNVLSTVINAEAWANIFSENESITKELFLILK